MYETKAGDEAMIDQLQEQTGNMFGAVKTKTSKGYK